MRQQRRLIAVLPQERCAAGSWLHKLPQPTAEERKAPGAARAAGDLLALMGDDGVAADDDGDDG